MVLSCMHTAAQKNVENVEKSFKNTKKPDSCYLKNLSTRIFP